MEYRNLAKREEIVILDDETQEPQSDLDAKKGKVGEGSGKLLLSVDPGTVNLGWATIAKDTRTPVSSNKENVSDGPTGTMANIGAWMDRMVRRNPGIDELVVEPQIYKGHASHYMCLIQGAIMGAAATKGIKVAEYPVTSVRAYWRLMGYNFTTGEGSRKANKREGMRIVEERYPCFILETDHESDALIMGIAYLERDETGKGRNKSSPKKAVDKGRGAEGRTKAKPKDKVEEEDVQDKDKGKDKVDGKRRRSVKRKRPVNTKRGGVESDEEVEQPSGGDDEEGGEKPIDKGKDLGAKPRPSKRAKKD